MSTGTIVHQVPGRLRMRLSARRGDAEYFSTLCEKMKQIPNVQSCEANPVTASIVVKYAGETEPLLRQILERIPELVIERSSPIRSGRHSGMPPVRLVSGRAITPMFVIGSALAAIGLVQTMRGKVAVPSITAFWYALDAFRQSGKTG